MSSATSQLSIRIATTGVQTAIADFKSLGAAVTKFVAAPLAAFVTAREVKQTIGEVIGLGNQLAKLKAQTSTSAQELYAAGKAMERIGGDASSASFYIGRLRREIFDAASGNAEAKKQFDSLGLSVDGLSKLSGTQQLYEVGKAIAAIQNPAQRTALAMQFFGKSGDEALAIFRDPVAMEFLRGGGGKMGEVLGRNATGWRELVYNFHELLDMRREFAAGFLDMLPLDEITAAMKRVIDEVDFVGMGQKVGGWVALVIDYWKRGRVDEIISLTIQAGFEQGKVGVDWLWQQIRDMFTGNNALLLITTFSMSLIKGLAQAFVDLSAMLVELLTNLAAMLVGMLTDLVSGLVDMIVGALDAVFKKLDSMPWFKKMFGQSEWTKQGMGSFNIRDGADSFLAQIEKGRASYLSLVKDGADVAKSGIGSFFDRGITAASDVLGSGQSTPSLNATARLKELIAEQVKLREAVKETTDMQANVGAIVTAFDVKKWLNEQELELKDRLLGIERQRSDVENDYTKTKTEKWAERKRMLQEEQAALQAVIASLRQRMQMDGTSEAERQLLQQRSDSYESKLVGVDRQLGSMGPDPTSFREQFRSAFTELKEAAEINAKAIAQTFVNVFNTAVSSISSGITGLIMGTQTWGQALQQIGTTILTSIIGAIVQMGVRWIATQLMMMIVGKALMAGAVGATAPIAAEFAAMWTPAALAASTATFGGAVGAGSAALIGGTMETMPMMAMMSFMGGFRDGGFTGNGSVNDVAGFVHKREFVMPADAVSRIGVPAMEAIASGGGMGDVNVGAPEVHVVVVNDRSELKRYLESRAGGNIIVKQLNHRRMDAGMDT